MSRGKNQYNYILMILFDGVRAVAVETICNAGNRNYMVLFHSDDRREQSQAAEQQAGG